MCRIPYLTAYRIVASFNIRVREWNGNTIVNVVYNWNLNKTCMCNVVKFCRIAELYRIPVSGTSLKYGLKHTVPLAPFRFWNISALWSSWIWSSFWKFIIKTNRYALKLWQCYLGKHFYLPWSPRQGIIECNTIGHHRYPWLDGQSSVCTLLEHNRWILYKIEKQSIQYI